VEKQPNNDKKKKSRLKKLVCWLFVDLLVAAIVVLLLFYRPSGYHPILAALSDANGQRVHPYISKELGPAFYNGAHDQQPFRLTVLDGPLNEAIAQAAWLSEASGITLSSPQVSFEPDHVVLMGTADVQGADLIVTIAVKPQLDEQGLLNLNVDKVKIGAMNITPLARMMAKKMYEDRVATGTVDTEDLRTKVTASLLAGEAFDPIVPVDGKKVRLRSLNIAEGQLDAEWVPAP
jgi:hypothetical protein